MNLNITALQLSDPDVLESVKILHKCSHCGCCVSTCPTYELLGDEADSPRGRIYLIKDMLENGRSADSEVVTHIDRCLSCLGCLTACPAGVDYMHLVDHARAHIEDTYRRPLVDRFIRGMLAQVLPYPGRFRAAMRLARPFKRFAPLMNKLPTLKPVGAMLNAAPDSIPARSTNVIPGIFGAVGERKKRVILPSGCVQQVLDPEINRATINLLTRVGVEVVISSADNCCGALVHHLGKREQALAQARRNIDAWYESVQQGNVDAIVITTSGCGTTIKDYGHMLANDPNYAAKAAAISKLTKDVTEFLVTLNLPEPKLKLGLKVAYHSACSLQHGQKVLNEPRKLLLKAGLKSVRPEGEHLCCGSAGTYSILQPEISTRLRDRKVANLAATHADVIAAGNIGCLTQINTTSELPAVHIVLLLEWAWSGEKPAALAKYRIPESPNQKPKVARGA